MMLPIILNFSLAGEMLRVLCYDAAHCVGSSCAHHPHHIMIASYMVYGRCSSYYFYSEEIERATLAFCEKDRSCLRTPPLAFIVM